MSRKRVQTIMASCAECDSRIYFKKRPDLGKTVNCPECDTQMEVVSLSPLELYWAFEDDDFDNDYDYDDDYSDNGHGKE